MSFLLRNTIHIVFLTNQPISFAFDSTLWQTGTHRVEGQCLDKEAGLEGQRPQHCQDPKRLEAHRICEDCVCTESVKTTSARPSISRLVRWSVTTMGG